MRWVDALTMHAGSKCKDLSCDREELKRNLVLTSEAYIYRVFIRAASLSHTTVVHWLLDLCQCISPQALKMATDGVAEMFALNNIEPGPDSLANNNINNQRDYNYIIYCLSLSRMQVETRLKRLNFPVSHLHINLMSITIWLKPPRKEANKYKIWLKSVRPFWILPLCSCVVTW